MIRLYPKIIRNFVSFSWADSYFCMYYYHYHDHYCEVSSSVLAGVGATAILHKNLRSLKADLSNAMIWMVSIPYLISNSSSFSSKLFWSFQEHQWHLVLSSASCSTFVSIFRQGQNICLSFSFLLFPLRRREKRKSTKGPVFFFFFYFLLINTCSGLLTGILLSVCISKSERISNALFSWRNSGLWRYNLVVLSNFNTKWYYFTLFRVFHTDKSP